MPKPMNKPLKLAPGQERSIKVTLKSLRNPPLDIKLTSQPLNTSIHDIKAQVKEQTRIPVEKMKLLHNKKPVPDSKVLRDLLGETDQAVEFSVMVIGGAAAIPPAAEEGEGKQANAAGAAAGTSSSSTEPVGTEALGTEEFWTDLKGFLMQRLKDENVAESMSSLFKSSWESSSSKP